MKNPADIFEYFKHYSRELEAHGSRHLAVCFGEDIGKIHSWIRDGSHFGSSVPLYINRSHCVMFECIQQFSFYFLIIHKHISSRIEKCQKSTYYTHHPYAIHVVVDLFVYWRPLPYYTYPIISSLLLYYYRLPILPIAFALY